MEARKNQNPRDYEFIMKVTGKDFVPALAVAPNKNGGTASAGTNCTKSSSLLPNTMLPLNDEDIVFPKKICGNEMPAYL